MSNSQIMSYTMNYQSFEQGVTDLRQQGFFIYTNYCQKINLLKIQADNYFQDYLGNLGQLYIRMQLASKQFELSREEATRKYVEDSSERQEGISDSQTSNFSKGKNHREMLKYRKKIQRNLNNKKQRNALTNLGSQLLTFAYLRKKNLSSIKAKFPHISNEQILAYYEWARKVKQSMNGYINIEKLQEVWHQQPQQQLEKLYLKIFRSLSFHYINYLMIPAILTSKKIVDSGKALHLSARRKLLQAIRPNNQI